MERDLIQLFEAAKKAADTANTKGILLGQTEASRCVDILSRLKSFPISRTILQAKSIEKRLDHLTKHKNQKIRFTASGLLLQWRQSIRSQENQDSGNTKKPRDPATQGIPPKQPHRISLSSTASDCVEKTKPNPFKVSGNMRSYILKGGDQVETAGKATPMNETDLLELLQTIEKAANAAAEGSSSAAASRCVEALNQIKIIPWSLIRDFVFTTQIGNWVHSLIHHSNPQIRSAAESLFYDWLRILYSSNGNSSTSNENTSTQKKIQSKTMNKKIGGITSTKSRNERINSVLKKWKSSHRH